MFGVILDDQNKVVSIVPVSENGQEVETDFSPKGVSRKFFVDDLTASKLVVGEDASTANGV